MIEFKADCGHNVRAKDEDAGKVVRCAYCGREAQVPDDEPQDDFDFLFSDLGNEGSGSGPSSKSDQRKSAGRSGMPFRGPRNADPFVVVKKMAYVAAVLIVLIYVGKVYVWPLIQDMRSGAQITTAPPKPGPKPGPSGNTVAKPTKRPGGKGLLDPRLDRLGKEGVYVDPVPPDVTVYYKKLDDETDFSWIDNPTAKRLDAAPVAIDLSPGEYEIVVTIPLSSKQLWEFGSTYKPWRLKIEAEDVRGRRNSKADGLARDYLLPDDAVDVAIHLIERRQVVARRYVLTVRDSKWNVLTPMFLPRDNSMLEQSVLIARYIRGKRYGFDHRDVERELRFYEVPEEDQDYIVDILERTGCVSYPERRDSKHADKGKDAGGRYRIFRINPIDGALTTEELEGSRRTGKSR